MKKGPETKAIWESEDDEIRIGISSCLLGEEVRFDGGHKRDPFLVNTVARFVRYVPVCPEVEIGLGTPRESIRLEASDKGVRLVAPKSGVDLTGKMTRFSRRKAGELENQDLSGYILKKNSPSCGLFRVRVYGKKGAPAKNGRGLFASALADRHPLLPVEEEGRLHDPNLRENFLQRVFAYRRLKVMFRGRWSTGALVRFHTAEKLLLLAHEPKGYQTLGRLVARAKGRPRREVAEEYSHAFMGALSTIASKGRHMNVLQHIAGHFKTLLGRGERAELSELIEDYRRGLVPLVVPVTLIRHFVKLHDVEYLSGQTYLEPHPKELMLRNHV
jgi:uncharacterized protein YbgA (DUF1722 family)/uncharacterized protein YbbK (DUF523 family)